MTTIFDIVNEEFAAEMDAINALVTTFDKPEINPKSRIAAANAAVLLVAATFEEFVREMAREYARVVVNSVDSFSKLPPTIVSTAWKRTMEGLAKTKFDKDNSGNFDVSTLREAESRISVIVEFCKGDLTKEIYQDLIHNANNMRPGELNSLFKVSGLSNICVKASSKEAILEQFGEEDVGKAHARLIADLEDFFNRRNSIAHALNAEKSVAPNKIIEDIQLLCSFAKGIKDTLNEITSPPADSKAPLPAETVMNGAVMAK